MVSRVLLLGCGNRRNRIVRVGGRTTFEDQFLETLDINGDHKPMHLWDLNHTPWPFEPDRFDEIHAYEVLEHLGQLGDAEAFFSHFYEIWRILKPGGYLAATVPPWDGMWALGDPSHRRVINEGTLVFLDQEQYKIQVDGRDGEERKTPMSDFRNIWTGDFQASPPAWISRTSLPGLLAFVLEAVKPSRLAR